MDKLKALLKSVLSIKGLFVSVLSLTTLSIIYMIVVVSISPKYEGEEKGFTACSTAFLNCLSGYVDSSNYQKVVGAVECSFNNISCDVKIVKNGFVQWKDGDKNTPWELYLHSDISDAIKQYNTDVKEDAVVSQTDEALPKPCGDDAEAAGDNKAEKSDFCAITP